jgi:hypothetical protein
MSQSACHHLSLATIVLKRLCSLLTIKESNTLWCGLHVSIPHTHIYMLHLLIVPRRSKKKSIPTVVSAYPYQSCLDCTPFIHTYSEYTIIIKNEIRLQDHTIAKSAGNHQSNSWLSPMCGTVWGHFFHRPETITTTLRVRTIIMCSVLQSLSHSFGHSLFRHSSSWSKALLPLPRVTDSSIGYSSS